MASATDIEALDNIANEIKLFRESSIDADIANEIKLFRESMEIRLLSLQNISDDNSKVSSEIQRSIQKVLSELHNDARSLAVLKEFWEQMSFLVSEKLVSQISYETYFAELAAKGIYFSQLTQNKNSVMDNTYPLTELGLLTPYTGNSLLATKLLIPVKNLLDTVSHGSNEVTLTSVSSGPDCSVFYDIDNSIVEFTGLSVGSKYFIFTVTSTIGSSITAIANIQVN